MFHYDYAKYQITISVTFQNLPTSRISRIVFKPFFFFYKSACAIADVHCTETHSKTTHGENILEHCFVFIEIATYHTLN